MKALVKTTAGPGFVLKDVPEPKIRDDEVFVFDRNGLWRLRDTNGDGEADVHEMFSNAFGQTAETREYAHSVKVAPDGSFVIAKGGIQWTSLGKHNGSVLRISPDGKSSTVLGYGLRSPILGMHPKTGLVTASDQQGKGAFDPEFMKDLFASGEARGRGESPFVQEAGEALRGSLPAGR